MPKTPLSKTPIVVENIGKLITLEPLAKTFSGGSVTIKDLGILGPKAWLAIDQHGRVHGAGVAPLPSLYDQWTKVDAQGGLVLPGLVDSHTHPLWGGSRDGEFVLKAAGKTYQEIAQQEGGGGILTTVRATRQAGDEVLASLLGQRLERMRASGTTTVEVKSGYGLSVSEELRHLRLLHEVSTQQAMTLRITCLALHAPSPDFSKVDDYIARCCQELLPEAHRLGLISSVDAFVERGYFTPEMVQPYLQKATDLGLMIRLHADEFQESGAALLGATWGARSLDHLQCVSPDALPQVAASGSVATLLPGTSLYSRIPWAQASPLRQQGIPVALGSDFNPGSCLLSNLPLMASLGAVHCGLTLEEAIAAVTFIPAYSLGLTPHRYWGQQKQGGGGFKGALAPGFDGDFILYSHTRASQWLADFGQTPPQRLWIQGQEIALNGSGPQ